MLTHPDKVLFPQTGHTKQMVADYYKFVSTRMLPFMKNRPVSLVRAPNGVEQIRFYQRHPSEYFPEYIERVKLRGREGVGVYILIDAYEDLEYLVNLGTIEFHVWNSNVKNIDVPTHMIFDLDPAEDVSYHELTEGLQILHELLVWEGYEPCVKTSGIKGFHVSIRLDEGKENQEVLEDARLIAERLTNKYPKLFVASAEKSKRPGKIFIDYLRNARGATYVAPFSLRTWHLPTISCPVSWDLANQIRPDEITMENIIEYLAQSPLWV